MEYMYVLMVTKGRVLIIPPVQPCIPSAFVAALWPKFLGKVSFIAGSATHAN